MPVHGSISIPLFERAIRSIVAQSLANIELLIAFDGGISSELFDAASAWVQKDDRVRIIPTTEGGIAATLNALVRQARGEFIARMDSDDISLEHRLETQAEFLHKHPNVSIVGTWAREIDGGGKLLFEKKMPIELEEISRFMAKRDPFIHPTVMFRRAFFDEVGLYNCSPAYRYIEDTELWGRALARKKQLANIGEYHLQFHITGGTFAVGRRRGLRYASNEAFLRLRHCWQARLPFRYYFWPLAVFVARLLPGRALRMLYHFR